MVMECVKNKTLFVGLLFLTQKYKFENSYAH